MADTDPAATLHALAEWYHGIGSNRALAGSEQREATALAEHVEGVAQAYEDSFQVSGWAPKWLVDIVDSLLVVAAAAGVIKDTT